MKFNQKKAIELATTGGSAVVGTKISKAANTVLPASVKNPAVHGLLSIGTLVVASMITGNSLGAQVGRGVAIGVGIDQGNTAINEVVAPMLPAPTTKAKTALAAGFEANTPALDGLQGLKSYNPNVIGLLDAETTNVKQPIQINAVG